MIFLGKKLQFCKNIEMKSILNSALQQFKKYIFENIIRKLINQFISLKNN